MLDQKKRRFLIVDSDETWRRFVADILAPFGSVQAVAHAGEALAAVQESKWVGLVLDAVLSDGCGFELLTRVRALGVPLPALVLTTHHDRERVNRAHALQAEFLCKPPEADSVASFARRAVAYHWTRSPRIASILDAMATERQLTPRESELIAAAIAGMPRRLVADELGVSENTVKVQIRLLLVKCGVNNLDELADGIVRRALRGSGARPIVVPAELIDDSKRKISGR
jgi:DNA-binding NarL/FixJ family response regulator